MKRRYGVVRNGEHLFPLYPTREEAEAAAETIREADKRFHDEGWSDWPNWKPARVWAEEVRGRAW